MDLYRRAHQQLGTEAEPIGMHSPGFVAETDEEAKELFYPGYREIHDRIGAQRGWPRMQRGHFDAEVAGGSLYVGSVETVAQKMAHAIRVLDAGRFDMIYSAAGTVAADARRRSVELYGTQVIPRVRELLADDPGTRGGAR